MYLTSPTYRYNFYIVIVIIMVALAFSMKSIVGNDHIFNSHTYLRIDNSMVSSIL